MRNHAFARGMRWREVPGAGLLLVAVTVGVAGAQQDTTVRRDTAVLAPTVVTVTRTPLELGRAPYAIGVATRDDIQRGKPGLALDEALAGIAGVQVDNRFNYALGERISVRGMGARAQFGVRGVRVLLDGIPMTLADGQTTMNNVDVGSLARAEVIRGPSSALHGNASGGVIQLESDHAAAVPGDLVGELRATVGAFGLFRTQASFAGSGSAAGYSATLSRLTFDGFRQWSNARNDHAALRFVRDKLPGFLPS
jgi:iron complex outermembrane recepter protein